MRARPRALLLPLLTALGLQASPALADEVWDTPEGQMIYLEDAKGLAVWQMQTPQGEQRFYLPGLAGNFDNRAVHEGFWIGSGGPDCGSTLTGPDDFTGAAWGSLTLVFHEGGFPTDWTMLRGSCFGEQGNRLRGDSPLLP